MGDFGCWTLAVKDAVQRFIEEYARGWQLRRHAGPTEGRGVGGKWVETGLEMSTTHPKTGVARPQKAVDP